MCLSDTALSVYENLDCSAAVIEEAKNNAKNFEFISMCLCALASVLGCTIESYFPVTTDSAPREEWDSLAKMFNCWLLLCHNNIYLSLDTLFPKKATKTSTQLVASLSNILPSTSSASKSDVVK